MGQAANYFQTLASGNPAAMAKVLAPQISGIQQQVGQNVATLNQFAGRSGGTAAQAQQQGFEAQRAIQNLFDLLGPEAATELAQISSVQEGAGTSLLGLGAETAAEVGAQASGTRPGDVQTQQDQQGAVIEGLTSLFGL